MNIFLRQVQPLDIIATKATIRIPREIIVCHVCFHIVNIQLFLI
ncbi:hypothetical protein Phi40:1_gp067 [Cellulophaga phage phi40:1]|uniref:Uncharacterized protein n=1 Tax=Cellulophaga phage phi38:1 TaxID=1327977 RepID=S0A0T7_9CAUD|nr:hypothetical protein Phi38:1_gp067 [Cellulophaga phage phi38:1]AGO47932.1 hypothetical protein Phi40:1_gp067 [Cellulophaga phage phi40:1]AGO48097.1 hypothetical protein Phi38:1_gp067 [Cellulophaga phage phi38:1]